MYTNADTLRELWDVWMSRARRQELRLFARYLQEDMLEELDVPLREMNLAQLYRWLSEHVAMLDKDSPTGRVRPCDTRRECTDDISSRTATVRLVAPTTRKHKPP